jgi:mannose-6-phosphate isomerase-like protein (cupin superfamily)
MSRVGDVFENPVTGERVVVRVGAEEWFTVMGGRVGFRLGGHEIIAPHNERLHVPAGVAHDWWRTPGRRRRA